MSGRPASELEASSTARPRVLLVDDGKATDVFVVLEQVDGVVRVTTPFLFEIGEELRVRVEENGSVTDATARVRGHVKRGDDVITELELADQSEPRRMVTG